MVALLAQLDTYLCSRYPPESNHLLEIDSDQVVERATRAGFTSLKLETGVGQPEALGLYQRSGFVAGVPFGGYAIDPLSPFMEEKL